MSDGRDWMGEFVVVSPEVWARFEKGFGFHDAVFTGAGFPEDEDPKLTFDCACVRDRSVEYIPVEYIPVIVTLRETTELKITRPRDWVMKLEVTELGDSRAFRWIDAMTGYPMIEATASRIEIALPAELA